MDCCSIYTEQFDRDAAISQAQRYRERGLDRTARAMFAVLSEHGVAGYRVVEFGGGVGGLALELVKAGAASAVNVELSEAYREPAAALVREAGLEDRVELWPGDAIQLAAELGGVDVVMMNRVVCCYPEGGELMDVAIANARQWFGVSFPTVHAGSHIVIGIENWVRARRGSDFRAYVHPRSIFDRPAAAGFEQVYRRARPIWTTHVWRRRDPA